MTSGDFRVLFFASKRARTWRGCGHDELTGRRQRYRPLDWDCVSKWPRGMDRPKLFREYRQAIERTIEDRWPETQWDRGHGHGQP